MIDLVTLAERLTERDRQARIGRPLPWNDLRRARPAVTADRLRALLEYDPSVGVFVKKQNRCRNWKQGQACTSLDRDGYIRIGIDQQFYYAHRLAWLYTTGEWPTPGYDVDHINQNRTDNRFSNLRLASRSQNLTNGKLWSTNKSGLRGACFSKERNKWRATAFKRHLGYFDTKEQAHAAYRQEVERVHREFAPWAPTEIPISG